MAVCRAVVYFRAALGVLTVEFGAFLEALAPDALMHAMECAMECAMGMSYTTSASYITCACITTRVSKSASSVAPGSGYAP